MSEDEPISPERMERARRLAEGSYVSVPYPSAEATDLMDAVLLATVELLNDPEYLARHWLPPDDPQETP